MAKLRCRVAAPTSMASQPWSSASRQMPAVAPTSRPAFRPRSTSASPISSVTTIVAATANISISTPAAFHPITARRDTGADTTSSSSPCSSSPAIVAAPTPIASTRASSGSIRLKSSVSRNPGPLVMLSVSPIPRNDLSTSGYCLSRSSNCCDPSIEGNTATISAM